MADPQTMTDEELQRQIAELEKQLGITPSPFEDGVVSYAGELGSNIPGSALQTAENLVAPILHPIETAKSMVSLGSSVLGKLGITEADPEAAEAVGKYLADRYGGINEVMTTLRDDPVGLLADVSIVFTGGGALAARAPGVVGKAGQVISRAGRAADPVQLAIKAGKPVASFVARAPSEAPGMTTGTGGRSVREAFGAGVEGGARGDAFLRHMRGEAPIEEVVRFAKQAVEQMRRQRQAQYQSGMGPVRQDPTVLSFRNIERALRDVRNRGKYKGVVIDESAAGTWDEINKVVKEWKMLDPAQYHTAEGLDALKRRIGDIQATIPYDQRPALSAATAVYNAVKNEIAKQAPAYAKTMSDYEQASELINDIERTLSIPSGKRGNIDTSVRKLQSILRNNVNTNYGRRMELAQELESAGATELLPALAGQMMSSPTPRNLAAQTTAGTAGVMGYTFGASPAALLAAPLFSPRAVGETAYKAGQVAGPAVRLAQRTGPSLTPLQRLGQKYARSLGPSVQLQLGKAYVPLEERDPESMSREELEELMRKYEEQMQ